MIINPIQDGHLRQKSHHLPKNISQTSCNDETSLNFTLPKEDPKINKSRDTPPKFCQHQHFLPDIRKFCYIKKYRYRLHFDS